MSDPAEQSIGLDERGIVLLCLNCGKRNRMTYERLGQAFRCGHCHTALEPPGTPVDVSTTAAFEALTTCSPLPVLVDFWAEWCGPCKMVAPELAKVAAEGRQHWLVAKVNSDKLSEVAQRFQISAIPTLILFQSGRELIRKSGAMSAAAIRQFIHETLMATNA